MTIKIDIFNSGSSTASQVEMQDPGWDSQHFDIIGPSTTASFAKIGAGANVSHTFVV